MFLKAIPFVIKITFFLVSDVNSKDIRRTNDFDKGYLKELFDDFDNTNNDNLNDIESPMNEMEDPENPGMVAVVVMKDKIPQISQEPTPVFKTPERALPIETISLQEPVKVVDNNIGLTMGEDSNSDTSSELSGLDIDVNGIKDIDNTDSSKVQILRKALRSCSKKAFRRCKKACKAAYKITCADYYCSSRKKRALNRSCKSNCRMRFN